MKTFCLPHVCLFQVCPASGAMSVSKNSGGAVFGGMPFFEYHGVDPGAYYAGAPYRQVRTGTDLLPYATITVLSCN